MRYTINQIWENKQGEKCEIVAFHNGKIICQVTNSIPEIEGGYHSMDLERARLIHDPVWGDLSAYDLVPEEFKNEYMKPEPNKIEFYYCGTLGGESGWKPSDGGEWTASNVYRVPHGFDWEPYKIVRGTEEKGGIPTVMA